MKEPANNLDEIVPGRLTSAELRAMALRQQQQIDSQHQLLATKEQRLRFLKSQEVRNAVVNAEGERLRRLRERVEAQESKLRRLRALRGQVDLQKTYNVSLSNDLDSIRALFSEKEKELSLAVAKVEALTRQLEELRRDRRCPIGLLAADNGNAQPLPQQASRELEKLRRELVYRNQLSLQQDARLHLQREALQQRQAELRSVDQRIYELQTRLQRKKAANIHIVAQNQNNQLNAQAQHLQQQQQQQHQLAQKQQQQQQAKSLLFSNIDAAYRRQPGHMKQGVAALKQQLLQKQTANLQSHAASKFANIMNRDQNRSIPRGNVAAVEPYIHTPQKSAITPVVGGYLGTNNPLKHAAATANTNQQNQLIQDLAHVKLNLAKPHGSADGAHVQTNANFFGAESDETKLAKKMLTATLTANKVADMAKTAEVDPANYIYAEIGPKRRDINKQESTDALVSAASQPPASATSTATTANSNSNSSTTTLGSKIPKSVNGSASAAAIISKLNSASSAIARERLERERKPDNSTELNAEKLNQQQLMVHSMPLGAANRSLATGVSHITTTTTTATTTPSADSLLVKPKPLQHLTPGGGLMSSLRKPISSVAPTSVTNSSAIPKMVTYSPKVNRVAPNVIATQQSTASTAAAAAAAAVSEASERPVLPPKPSKMTTAETTTESGSSTTPSTVRLRKATAEFTNSGAAGVSAEAQQTTSSGLHALNINDNLPIKAKPLTIRKQPMSEQPRLKTVSGLPKPPAQNARKLELTATVYKDERCKDAPEHISSGSTSSSASSSPGTATTMHSSDQVGQQVQTDVTAPWLPDNQQSTSNRDELDRIEQHSGNDETPTEEMKRRTTALANPGGSKPKLARRVSFDPLALLLDASLEGELELVKKTAMQVPNPSAANDEGITALHNAICAGHFDIVKFLVEFGCDVNAQDSDGWTPLHCAASCNNLSMVKFLVENGACLFAATLSDHETPAEKCEEDEEGFDGCSEYLYSIQEKLGILHNGEVYAVFSYEAQNSDELTFHVNERLVILRKSDDAESEWWWAKNSNDEEGYVPRNLLGLYPRVSPQSSNFND